MNRMIAILPALALGFASGNALGDDATDDTTAKSEAQALTQEEIDNMTPAEREALRDQYVAAQAAKHNENIDNEQDKVVCKKERRTGSRQTQRVCRTVREFEEETEASQRMLRKRGRASTNPADVEGSSGGP